MYAGVGAGIAIAGLYCLVGGAAGTDAVSLWLQLGGLAVVLMLPVLAVLRRLRVEAFPRSAKPGVAARAPPGTLGIVVCYGAFGFGYILPATFLPVLARSVVDDPRLFGHGAGGPHDDGIRTRPDRRPRRIVTVATRSGRRRPGPGAANRRGIPAAQRGVAVA